MSRRKRKKSKSAGNIKAEAAYDPFQKYGLVKQYEPFIRREVGEFCKRYPQLRRDDLLFEVIRLALAAVKSFKPALGYDFRRCYAITLRGCVGLPSGRPNSIPCRFRRCFRKRRTRGAGSRPNKNPNKPKPQRPNFWAVPTARELP